MKKKVFIGFLLVGALTMWIMSCHYFQNDDSGILRNKKVASQLWYIIVFRTHIGFGLLAILVGPIQFVHRFRAQYPRLHRRCGYWYFTSVVLSGLSGLLIAQFSMGGWVSRLGFTVLSVLWLILTSKSILAVTVSDIVGHQKWSYLGYSLTFAAITQRTLLLIPLLTNVSFMHIYQFSAWLPWILNLLIANRLYQSTRSKQKLNPS